MEQAIRRSQKFYIVEAAVEYFIAILVGTSYLATLTTALGIPDSLTGILSSFITLGCVFQLFSVFLKRKRVKGTCITLGILNQLLFMLLYVIPLVGSEGQGRVILFIIVLLLAYLIYYGVFPLQLSWLMSLCEDWRRGIFTAQKEIVSLLGGMVFSYGAGVLIDHYKEKGDLNTAFLICAIVIFVLMAINTVLLVLCVEPEEKGLEQEEEKTHHGLSEMIRVGKNPAVLKITVLFSLMTASLGVSTPYYGTYQIKELGFSLALVSILGIVGSLARAGIAPFLGKYADKKSFSIMLRLCLWIMLVGFGICVFCVPANGLWTFGLYTVLNAMYYGGANSAKINLVFDMVPHGQVSDALAYSQAVSGLVGFGATLAVSPLVSLIQKNGNTLFGIPVYAQQVLSVLALILTAVQIVYVTVAIIPLNRKKTEQ